MIKHEWFTYSDEQWDKIKVVLLNRLGRDDADQLELTRTDGNATATQSLRSCIETVALLHILGSARRQSDAGTQGPHHGTERDAGQSQGPARRHH